MKKILFLMIILAGLCTTSCNEDFLDTVPTRYYSDEVVFATTEGCWGALNGIHRDLYSQYNSNQSNGGLGGLMIFNDALGEDLVFPANQWYVNIYNWTTHRTKTHNTTFFPYQLYYELIGNANKILDNVDNAVGADSDKEKIKAEALTYRGWALFYVVQLYAKRYDSATASSDPGVPILTTFTTEPQPRATVADVYKQVNEDLKNAVNLFNKESYDRKNKTHFNATVATAMLARVALVMGDYANAKKYASDARAAFTAEGGRLMTTSEYKAGFNSADNPEWMWASIVQDDQTMYFYAFHAFMSWNFNASAIRGCPKCISKALYDQISATDVRKTLWEPAPTAENFPLPATSYTRFPYMNRKFATPDNGSSVADIPYMRLAEMYLIEAEAKARLGEADAAQLLFDYVKTRDEEYTLSTKTGQALVDEILVQRRAELWGEGQRFYDLKRTNAPLNREGSNHNAALAVKMKEDAGTVNWQFHFPKAEEDANPNIASNPNP